MTVCELLLKNRKLFIVERWVTVLDGRLSNKDLVTSTISSTDALGC